MRDIMVDLETMGVDNNAAIVSIGAVQFDPETGEIGSEFYEVIDLSSCVEAGLTLDASTIMWWVGQSEAARKALMTPTGTLSEILEKFTRWLPSRPKIWGNGATFDNIILRSAYKALSMDVPWKYYDERCFRTLKKEVPVASVPFKGVHHNALDDARYQAQCAIEIFNSLRPKLSDECKGDIRKVISDSIDMMILGDQLFSRVLSCLEAHGVK